MLIEPKHTVEFVETDFTSPTWLRMRKCFQERIALLQTQLEDIKRTETETQVIRGRIKELRSLLLLSESAPALPVDDA